RAGPAASPMELRTHDVLSGRPADRRTRPGRGGAPRRPTDGPARRVREDRTMRRVLLGGLGIALGVFVRPAVAQDWPPRPASVQSAPKSAERGARLGRPVAAVEPA